LFAQARAFLVAHVHPQSVHHWSACLPTLDHAALVPPQAWTDRCDKRESCGVLLRGGKSNDAAQTAAHDRGAFASAFGAIICIDKRLQFRGQPVKIALAFAATTHRLSVAARIIHVNIRGVIADAVWRVPYADNDDRWNCTAMNQLGRHFVGAPLATKKRSGWIEEILSILHIQHRIVAVRIQWVAISGRQPHGDIARQQIFLKRRTHRRMHANFTGDANMRANRFTRKLRRIGCSAMHGRGGKADECDGDAKHCETLYESFQQFVGSVPEAHGKNEGLYMENGYISC